MWVRGHALGHLQSISPWLFGDAPQKLQVAGFHFFFVNPATVELVLTCRFYFQSRHRLVSACQLHVQILRGEWKRYKLTWVTREYLVLACLLMSFHYFWHCFRNAKNTRPRFRVFVYVIIHDFAQFCMSVASWSPCLCSSATTPCHLRSFFRLQIRKSNDRAILLALISRDFGRRYSLHGMCALIPRTFNRAVSWTANGNGAHWHKRSCALWLSGWQKNLCVRNTAPQCLPFSSMKQTLGFVFVVSNLDIRQPCPCLLWLLQPPPRPNRMCPRLKLITLGRKMTSM